MARKTVWGSFICVLAVSTVNADSVLRIGITQSKKGEARKYAPLIDYMKSKGIDVELSSMRDYGDAASRFAAGEIDAMFSGSGIAGCMMIKGVAEPLIRPVKKDGTSTSWAVMIGKKGSSAFDGSASFFQGKKVLACGLASSGEFFFRSLHKGEKLKGLLLRAASHGAAINALSKGIADYAIVKNRVWDSEKQNAKFANLETLGKDSGKNPDSTLIVSKALSPAIKEKIKQCLLGLGSDPSPKAHTLKESLGIKQFTETTQEDFQHTLRLLRDVGVKENFNFAFSDQ